MVRSSPRGDTEDREIEGECLRAKRQVLSVSIDDVTILPYILGTLNNTELAFKLASRATLPGADDLYMK